MVEARMTGRGWLKAPALAICGLWLGHPGAAGAAGFSAPDPGVKAMGLAGAFVARADDPTAGFFNPGALALVAKGKLTAGVAGEYLGDSRYQGLPPGIGAGTAAQQEKQILPAASAFALKALGKSLKVGVGFYSPYGFNTEWADQDTFAGRFVATNAQLQSYDLNANVAWQVTPGLGLGAGVIYRTSQLSMGRRLSGFQPGVGPRDVGSFAIDTDWETGIGWDAGVLFKVGDRFSIGASYRSPIDITYAGAGKLTQIVTGDATFDALNRITLPYGTSLPVATSIGFPSTATFGVGFAPVKSLWVEGDVTQTAWSRFTGLNVAFTSEPGFSQILQAPWEDTLSYRLGFQLSLSKGRQLRFGYALEESPQPDASVGPFLSDAQRSIFSAGFGRDWLDIAFQYIAPESRTTLTSADALNGTYSGNTYLLGVSVTKK
jgi:long-chain fatty acid transport protein